MKKAQNLIEVSVMVCIVVVISIAMWSVINSQKLKLVNLSKTTETAGKAARIITKPPTIVPPSEIDESPTQPETSGGSAH